MITLFLAIGFLAYYKHPWAIGIVLAWEVAVDLTYYWLSRR